MNYPKVILLALIFSSFSTVCTFAQAEMGELLARWNDSSLVGSSQYNNTYNEIWGLAVNDKEYAVIGTTRGTHFIDVTDPTDVYEAYVIDGAAQGTAIVHRDYHDLNGYLYIVCDEGLSSTLQIVDISNLPDQPIVVYDNNEIIHRAHNIFIDTTAERLWALSLQDANGPSGYAIWDISNPIDPVLLKRSNTIGPVIVSTVHDAYIDDNRAYLNCGLDGLIIADFSDFNNEQIIANLETSEYPQSGYNHSGWPSADGNFYFFADETHGKDMKVYDISNLPDMDLVATIDAANSSNKSIPHNQIVKGNHLYTAYYYDGLQVHDFSDPDDIKRVLFYPTSNLTATNDFEGAWGVYPFLPSGNILVSDMQEGLFVIKGIDGISASKDMNTIQNIDIFPNPAFANVSIQNNNEMTIESVIVMDALGRIVNKSVVDIKQGITKNISLGESQGMNILKITFKNGNVITKKIMKH